MHNKNKVLKIISLCTVICFAFNTLAQAAPANIFLSEQSAFPSDFQNYSFKLPSDLGTLESFHIASKSEQPSVYLIEDAHSSKAAQEKISDILGFLKKEKRLDAVFLEGSSGKLDRGALRTFESEAQNKLFWTHLFSENMLSGAEKFILFSSSIPAFGMEGVSRYRENLEIYRSVLKEKNNSNHFVSELRKKISAVSEKTLSKELKVFLSAWQSMHAQNASLLNYLNTLFDYSSRYLKYNWEDYKLQKEWPQLVRVWRINRLQKTLDQDKAQKEFRLLKSHLMSPALPEIQMLESLLQSSPEQIASERSFEISPRTLAEVLISQLPSNQRSMAPYRHFADFLAVLIFQSELGGTGLFDEMDKLENRIFNMLATDEKTKNCVSAYKNFFILKKALQLELTRPEAADFKKHIREFEPSQFKKQLSLSNLNDGNDVSNLLPLISQFYSVATLREEGFIANYQYFLRNNSSRVKNIALIAGGYHCEGIQQLLKNKKISYCVIRPAINDDPDDSRYQNFLLGNYAQNSYLAPTGMMMAPILSRKMMGDQAYENRSLKIEELRGDFEKENSIKSKAASLGNSADDKKTDRRGFLKDTLLLAAKTSFLAGLIGCAVGQREADNMAGERRPASLNAPLVLSSDKLNLTQMRGFLFNNNYRLSASAMDVYMRQRERDLVGDNWQADASVEYDGNFTVFGSASGKNGLIAKAGSQVLDPFGDKFTLAAEVAFEIIRFLTGEKKAQRVDAYMRAQVAISELKENMDGLYLQASELLIEIAYLQRQKQILSDWLPRVEALKRDADAAARGGVATVTQVLPIQKEMDDRRAALIENDRQIGLKTNQLMTMISRASQDFQRNFTADINLDAAIPDWNPSDIEGMTQRATRIQSRTVNGDVFNTLPPNTKIATAFTRWQQARTAQRAQELTFTRPEIPIDRLFFSEDSRGLGDSVPELRGNTAISGQAGRETQESLAALRRIWEIGPRQEATRQILSLASARADESVESVIHETQSEISRLFSDVQAKKLLIAQFEESIRQLDQSLESMRRVMPGGRRLVARDFELVREEASKIDFQISILRAKKDIRTDLEKLFVLGAISAEARGSSLGEWSEKLLPKGKELLDKYLELSFGKQIAILALAFPVLSALTVAAPFVFSIGVLSHSIYELLISPIVSKIKTLERPAISMPAIPKISAPSVDWKPLFSGLALKVGRVGGIIAALASSFMGVLSRFWIYLQSVEWAAKGSALKKSKRFKIGFASVVFMAGIVAFPSRWIPERVSIHSAGNAVIESRTKTSEPLNTPLVISGPVLTPDQPPAPVVPLHPVVPDPQPRPVEAVPVRLVEDTDQRVEISGRANVLFRGDPSRGMTFKAKTSGRIEFLIPETTVNVEQGVPILRIVNEDLNARINVQQERANSIRAELDRLVQAVQTPELQILELERTFHAVVSNLNELKRELEVFGTFKAPFPMTITSRSGGNIAVGGTLFEGLRRDLIRIQVEVPPSAINFSEIQVSINRTNADVVQAFYGGIDLKQNPRREVILDLQLANPLTNITDKFNYTAVFENRPAPANEWKYTGEVATAIEVRAGEREIRDVVAPQVAGRTTFIVREGEVVRSGQVVARSEGEDFFESEISRLTEFFGRVQQFILTAKPRNSGDQWIVPANAVAELNTEGANIYPVAAARRLTHVQSPTGGVLTRSSDQNSLVNLPGDKIGEIWTSSAFAGDSRSGNLQNQLLVKADTPINYNDIEVVQLPSGQQLLAKLIESRDAIENRQQDVAGFKSIRIEIYDPQLLVIPNDTLRVIIPAQAEQDQLKSRYDGLLKSQAWREGFRAFPRAMAPTELPILVEMAVTRGRVDKLPENLVQLILREENPVYRQDAYDYFIHNLRDGNFYVSLEQLIYSGRADISQQALRLLRDEKDVQRLINIFSKSVDARNDFVSALSARSIFELLELSADGDSHSPLSVLVSQSRVDAAFREKAERLAVSILISRGPESLIGAKILRSGFFTNPELARLYRVMKTSNPDLSDVLRAEIIRRIAITKIEGHRLGFLARQIKNGVSGLYYEDPQDDVYTAEENFKQDIRFLTISPYWMIMEGHIESRIVNESKAEAQNQINQAADQTGPSVSLIALNFSLFPDSVFANGTVSQQTAYIRELGHSGKFRDLTYLLQTSQANQFQANEAVHQLLKSAEGRFELARIYKESSDEAVLSSIDSTVFPQFFLEDVLALRTTPQTNPGMYRFYQDVLLKLYSRVQSVSMKKTIVAYMLSTFEQSDFQLRFLMADGSIDFQFNDINKVVPQREITTAASRELERRSTLWAMELVKNRFEMTNEGVFIPGSMAAVMNLLEEKTAIKNFAQSSESLVSFLEDYAKKNRLDETDAKLLNYMVRKINQRIEDVKTNNRPQISVRTWINTGYEALITVGKFLIQFAFLAVLLVLVVKGFRRLKNKYFPRDILREELSALREEIGIENPDQDDEANGASLGSASFQKWGALLERQGKELTMADFEKMLFVAKAIVNDKKNIFSLERIVSKGHQKRSEEVGRRYRFLTQTTILTMKVMIRFQQEKSKNLTSVQKEKLFYLLHEFKKIADYANSFRYMLNPLVNLQILSGYGAPKYKGSSYIKKALNLLNRIIWIMVRTVYGYSFAMMRSKSLFLKQLRIVVAKGNLVEPNLYPEKLIPQADNYFKHQGSFQAEVKDVDLLGISPGWAKRKLLSRLLGFVPFVAVLLVTVPFFISVILFYFGVDFKIGKLQIDYVTASILPIAGIAFTLFLHSYHLSWKDSFYRDRNKEISGLEEYAARLFFEKNEADEIIRKINRGQFDEEELIRFEYNQSLEALRKEIDSDAPSAHVIVVIVDNVPNAAKKDSLVKHLASWIREDIPVIYQEKSVIKGSGAAWLKARYEVEKYYDDLKKQYSHLPDNFADLRIITLLANDSPDGLVPIELKNGRKLSFPIAMNGRPMTGIQMALANGYKASQLLMDQHRPGQIILATDKLYIGSIPEEGDITLLGTWASIEEVIQKRLEMVFGFFNDMNRAVKFIKFLGEKNLRRETRKRKKMIDQLDLGNRYKGQMPAFAGTVIIAPKDAGKYKRINQILDNFYREIKGIAEKSQTSDSVEVDLVQDVLIPLIIKSEGNNLRTFEAIRTEDVFKQLDAPGYFFYTMLSRFFEGLFKQAANKIDIRVSLPFRSFFTPLEIPKIQNQTQLPAVEVSPSPSQLPAPEPSVASASSLGYFAVRNSRSIPSESSQLEAAMRIAYSIIGVQLSGTVRNRLLKRLDEVQQSQENIFSRFQANSEFANPQSGRVLFVDAAILGDVALKHLVLENHPMFIVFGAQDRNRLEELKKNIDGLPLELQNRIKQNVYLALTPKRASSFVNAVLQPGNTKMKDAQNFLIRNSGGDSSADAKQMVFLSSDKNDAGKVSALKVGFRYFGGKYSSKLSLIDERALSRDVALLRVIESGELWQGESSRVQDLKPMLDKIIQEIMTDLTTMSLLRQAA